MSTTAPRWASIGFVVASAVVAVAHLLVIWQSLTAARLWEDEAFNLTVPLNLLAGLGYTSDGTLSGSVPTPFDPRISTGPVVLLPIAAVLVTGADLVIGSRLVPLLFFAALLVAVGVAGRRLGGRWGALVALTIPLVFTAAALPSPIQGPTDVLGEIPAAALLAWAVVVLERRPWLAGLFLGLAVQAKYIAVLALPAIGIGFLLLTIGITWVVRLRRLVVPTLFVALPTVVVEVFALIALGPDGFVDHLRRTAGFLRDGGQGDQGSGPDAKLSALLDAWQVAPAVVGVAAMTAVGVGVWAAVDVVRSRGALRDVFRHPRVVIATVSAAGLGTCLAWWLTAGHLPAWVRHPAPGILAFSPMLAAAVVAAVRRLAKRPGSSSIVARVGGGILAAIITAQAVVAGSSALPRSDTPLEAQRAVAAEVAGAGAEWIATPWGYGVSIVVLAGAHVALSDAPPANVSGYPRLVKDDSGCRGETLVEAPPYLLCAP